MFELVIVLAVPRDHTLAEVTGIFNGKGLKPAARLAKGSG